MSRLEVKPLMREGAIAQARQHMRLGKYQLLLAPRCHTVNQSCNFMTGSQGIPYLPALIQLLFPTRFTRLAIASASSSMSNKRVSPRRIEDLEVDYTNESTRVIFVVCDLK